MRALHIFYRFLFFVKFAPLKHVILKGNIFDMKYQQYKVAR